MATWTVRHFNVYSSTAYSSDNLQDVVVYPVFIFAIDKGNSVFVIQDFDADGMSRRAAHRLNEGNDVESLVPLCAPITERISTESPWHPNTLVMRQNRMDSDPKNLLAT